MKGLLVIILIFRELMKKRREWKKTDRYRLRVEEPKEMIFCTFMLLENQNTVLPLGSTANDPLALIQRSEVTSFIISR